MRAGEKLQVLGVNLPRSQGCEVGRPTLALLSFGIEALGSLRDLGASATLAAIAMATEALPE